MQNHIKQAFTSQKINRQSLLQASFRELHDRKLTMEQVSRVAIERTGDIHIEVQENGKFRFFVYAANALQELQPEGDPKIPLASKLQDNNFTSGHTIISYRPGRRLVLGPVHGRQGNIIKGYKKHRAVQALERYAIAQSACEQGGFDVPELLQPNSDNDCLVMAKRSGQTPDLALDAKGIWDGIGSCLKHFQKFETTDDLKTFNCFDELAVLDERVRRYLLCVPALPRQWIDDRERLAEAALNLPSIVNGLAHRDLHDRQFIVAGDSITLLDFDLICMADLALDAGNLLVHMKLRALQCGWGNRISAVSACSKAFLTGLGRQKEPGFEQRLLFYQATTCYRLALLYALRPRWAHLTEALMLEGKRCIKAFNGLAGRS